MERFENQDILQSSEILEIISKYKASQKFISRMLGWGEITLTRYVNSNYIPNKVNSDKLRSIENPYVFKKLLETKIEETNGVILNDTAFIRLQDSVNNHITNVEKSKGKIFQIANWFLAQADDENGITHLTLQRLLYLSQAWNLAINGEALFEEDCEVDETGPIYRVIYEEFQIFKSQNLPRVKKMISLSYDDEVILEYIKKYYFEVYTSLVIGRFCRGEEPYKMVKDVMSKDCAGVIIEKDTIREYYQKIAQEYNITTKNFENIKDYLGELLFEDAYLK